MILTALGFWGIFFYPDKFRAKTIIVEREEKTEEIPTPAPESINNCANAERRPIALMIAEDHEARPLYGISFADIVVEMPVVTGSITRMMAIFICEDPEEIGSIRSARHDFIPLALGYDAIFAHWGGSRFALDELAGGIVDNLDAMPNYFDAFYRKIGIRAPHNGFTSMARMLNAAEKLGYRLATKFEGYKFLNPNEQIPVFSNDGETIEINYKYPYNVRYEYNTKTNSYLRWRGGFVEIDKLANRQADAKNVVIMRAKSRQIGEGYNDVDILGSGEAVVYRNGEEIKGSWEKKKAEDVLRFLDETREEISFVPGSIWINIVEPSTIVNYEL
ncbi:MAG: DUF3048 domain-containing protein [Candidatus Spechtbacterales bacterium]